MKKLLIPLVFFSLNTLIFSQEKSQEVKFIVYSHSVNDNESVYIAGNDVQLGEWDPSSILLDKINDSTWEKSFYFTIGKTLEYKFTKGSWEHEALANDGSIPDNFVLQVLKDTIISTSILKWRTIEKRKIHGQITGKVKYHLNFEGDSLKARDIIVWLPPSYGSDINKRYPVLYMHDGQNIIDPATSSFGYDWRVDEVTDSLIEAGVINEIIIVGIYNTSDREYEYSYSPLGYKYMNFIASKLKPFIDKEYRTLPDRKNTAICGSSMGGLISMMTIWNCPEVFSKAACLSPAFKIRNLNYVDSIFNYSGSKKDIKIYIDNGGVGIDADLEPGTDMMIAALQSRGYELGKDIIWFTDKNASHSETAWADRIWRPLVFFFSTYQEHK